VSWNAGAGRPNWFRCWACRRGKVRGADELGVRLTGRVRSRRRTTLRHGAIVREYECRRCGHVGWSAHQDLAILPAALTIE